MSDSVIKKNTIAKTYFVQLFKSHLLMIVLTGTSFLYIQQYAGSSSPQIFFWAFLVLLALNTLISLHNIRPMNKVLKRLNSMKVRLNHDQEIQLSYKKSEWALIHGILDFIEKDIDSKKSEVEDSNLQAEIILSSIPSSVVVVDKFQNIVQANESFKLEFGTSLSSKLKLWKVIDQKALCEKIEHAISNELPYEELGFYNEKTNEYFDIRFTPLRDNQKNFIGVVGLFHNVTSSKLTEKMRVDFVANVSHEMRTPLTSLKGYAQLLHAQSKDLPQDVINIANKIENNSERLKDLFTSLLALSKIESQNSIKIEKININSLIQRIITDLQAKHLNKKISLELDLKEEFFFADQKLIEQVFINLIDNSIKYAQKDPIIKIKTFMENDYIKIHIIDNGPGIKKENINRIFERFYRIQGESSEVIEGVGLGLSIVKHIINKHDATIRVISSLQQGSTFSLSFPLEENVRHNVKAL
jgi:two-component system phosphate regulon sensor histidine kinase PhoR